NLQFSKLPYLKRLEAFDFDAQPGLDRRLIEELATGRFLYEGRNVILLGPPGVGKTHLAIALAVITAELGHRVYFVTAVDLARKLSKAMADNRLHRELNSLIHKKLVVIDEVGYLALDPAQSALVFQVICRRYDGGLSTVLTSSTGFAVRGQVVGGVPALASAGPAR